MIAAIAALVIYVTIADIKRRSKMTRAERKAERREEEGHGME